MRHALLLVLIFGNGCLEHAGGAYPTAVTPVATDSALGPGDLFDIRVFGEAELSTTYQVNDEGAITFPMIGTVVVVGKTPPQIESELRRRLADGYIKNPSVSVLVREARSKKVSVMGQVRQPGTFPYVENMSVIEAITRAGGFTAMAQKNNVKVTRGAQTFEIPVDDISQGKAKPFILRPGDVISVPERLF